MANRPDLDLEDEFDSEDLSDDEQTGDEEIDDIEIASFVPADALAVLEGFDVAIESRPVKVKVERAKRIEPAWEAYLAWMKDKPGVDARLFDYPEAMYGTEKEDGAKARAQQRARSMRSRLIRKSPEDSWSIEAVEVPEDKTWRIYVQYVGPASKELVAERAAKHEAAVARGHVAAAARKAAAEKSTAKAN